MREMIQLCRVRCSNNNNINNKENKYLFLSTLCLQQLLSFLFHAFRILRLVRYSIAVKLNSFRYSIMS